MIERCVSSLVETNPAWDYHFYTDEDWSKVITSESVFNWTDLMNYPTGIQRSDVFRCAALYEAGGCYADVDMIGVRSIDSLIQSACEMGLANDDTELILTIDHPVHSRMYFGREKVYMNNFMLAKPGARFLEIFLKAMKMAVAHGPCGSTAPVYSTGPVAMTRLIHEYGGLEELKIAVVPYFWINPIPDMAIRFPEKPIYQRMIEDGSWRLEIAPYFIHCWWHSYIDVETVSHYGKLFDHLPMSRGNPPAMLAS